MKRDVQNGIYSLIVNLLCLKKSKDNTCYSCYYSAFLLQSFNHRYQWCKYSYSTDINTGLTKSSQPYLGF